MDGASRPQTWRQHGSALNLHYFKVPAGGASQSPSYLNSLLVFSFLSNVANRANMLMSGTTNVVMCQMLMCLRVCLCTGSQSVSPFLSSLPVTIHSKPTWLRP